MTTVRYPAHCGLTCPACRWFLQNGYNLIPLNPNSDQRHASSTIDAAIAAKRKGDK